eukprot:397580-Pelagomonas_calceolata.AAC.1
MFNNPPVTMRQIQGILADDSWAIREGKIIALYPPTRAAEQKHRDLQPDLAKKKLTHNELQ